MPLEIISMIGSLVYRASFAGCLAIVRKVSELQFVLSATFARARPTPFFASNASIWQFLHLPLHDFVCIPYFTWRCLSRFFVPHISHRASCLAPNARSPRRQRPLVDKVSIFLHILYVFRRGYLPLGSSFTFPRMFLCVYLGVSR